MANIYLSYSRKDSKLALDLADRLKQLGHTITVDIDILKAGQDWREALTRGLREANVFVALLTENSQQSQWVVSELGVALGYAQANKQTLLLPVILGDIQIPEFIQHIQCIISRERNIDQVAKNIHEAANAFTGQLVAEAEKQDAARKRIEKNASEFINEAVSSLGDFESRNRWIGIFWYVVGFLALLTGLGVAYHSITIALATSPSSWTSFAYVTLKNVLAIALLGAAAKYAFTLGKSFTSEALKASDRLHAISFGKFYLQVYGETATWPEVKEAFQHWNIDRRSSFSELDPVSIDPQVMAVLIEAAKSLSNIKKSNDKPSKALSRKRTKPSIKSKD